MLLSQHVMAFSHVKTPEGVSKVDYRQRFKAFAFSDNVLLITVYALILFIAFIFCRVQNMFCPASVVCFFRNPETPCG